MNRTHSGKAWRGFGVLGSVLVAAVMLLSGAPAMAQDGGGGPGRGGRPDFRNMTDQQRQEFRQRMQQRMDEMRKQVDKRMQESLGLSEQEYAAIKPMIEKIRQQKMALATAARPQRGDVGRRGRGDRDRGNRAGDNNNPNQASSNADNGDNNNRGGGRQGFRGWRGGMFGDAQPSPEAQALTKAMGDLRQAVGDKATSADALHQKVQAVQSARKALQASIDQAQADLRGVVTPRQEAVLMVDGVLD